MPYPAKIQETLDMVELMPDRVDRILALISLSKNFKQVSDEAASRPYQESHRIPGCESEVFAWVTTVSGLLRVDFAIENQQGVSAMALAVLLKDQGGARRKERLVSVSVVLR